MREKKDFDKIKEGCHQGKKQQDEGSEQKRSEVRKMQVGWYPHSQFTGQRPTGHKGGRNGSEKKGIKQGG